MLRIQKGLLTPLHPKGGNLFFTFQERSNHSSEWFPSEVTSIDNNQGPNILQLMLQSAGLESPDLAGEIGNGMFQGLGYHFSQHTEPQKGRKQRVHPLLRIHSNPALCLADSFS